ncbi:MAG: DUF2207 domain-containing protein [Alphaproteobacteria bacterium]|nr:DUF2207 domain-containing protein [Alphaproteobacteria bacterium]
MKKLFFTICFTICSIWAISSEARVQSIVGPIQTPPQPQAEINPVPNNLPDPNNEEEVRAFFKKRLAEAARSIVKKDVDLTSVNSVNIVHSPEYYEAKKEQNKPFFQKIYEKALSSIHQDEEVFSDNTYSSDGYEAEDKQIAETATRFFTLQQEETEIQRPQVPTVALTLPSGRRILAPAKEHIPYFLSYINIQANGYIKIEDTVVVIANGQKFNSALQRIFPKYADKNQRMEFMLEKVTVNGTEIPYITEEIGNNIVLKPKYRQSLKNGVYTYVFTYIVNNELLHNKDNVILNWNLLGSSLNTIITSANAIISLPTGHTFNNAFSLIGSGDNYTDKRTNIFRFSGNTLAFSSNTPILNNENFNLIAEMNKNVFIKDFDNNFSTFLINWGNIAYAVLGLIAILSSFLLSLVGLKKERKANKYTPSYNGALMRSILVGKYDRTAFVSQLLDLYRKNVIDITQENNRLFLHKRNFDKSKLQKHELKALKYLFAKNINTVEINTANNVILKKAYRILSAKIMKQIKKYRIIHNISYVLFSCAMLLLTEIFISYISINFAQTLIILLSTTLLYAFYIWIIRHRFKHWYINIPTKLFALLSLVTIWGFSSIYVGGITSFLVIIMLAVIFAFTRIFGEQNNFINEAKNSIAKYKEYLQSNADAINLSRDFINQQSNIFALDIAEYFQQNVSNKNFHKLDLAENIKQTLIGII